MPIYKYKLPDGTEGEYSATDDADATEKYGVITASIKRHAVDPSSLAPQPQPPAAPTKNYMPSPEKLKVLQAADRARYSPAKDMSWYEKAGIGAIGGAQAASVGARDLASKVLPWIPAPQPEELAAREEWDKIKEPLGNWGTAGEIGGESLVTAPVGGPAAEGAGAILKQAVPKAAEWAKKGGKYLNNGVFGRSAVQGAAQGGLVGESTDRSLLDRADDVAKGFGLGLTGPAVLKVVSLPFVWGSKLAGGAKLMLSKSASDIDKKVYDAFKRTWGEDVIEDIYTKMDKAYPPAFPMTTAGLSGNEAAAAMERGARGRKGAQQFSKIDEQVARDVNEHFINIPKKDQTEAGDILYSKFMHSGVPVSNGRVFGDPGNMVPEFGASPLRKAMAKLAGHFSDTERDTFGQIAGDLTKHERYKRAVGPTQWDLGNGQAHISNALAGASMAKGSPMLWKVRSIFNSVAGGAKDETIDAADRALADPDTFMNLVDRIRSKMDGNIPLTRGEEIMKEAIETASTSGGRAAAMAPTTQPDKPKRY